MPAREIICYVLYCINLMLDVCMQGAGVAQLVSVRNFGAGGSRFDPRVTPTSASTFF